MKRTSFLAIILTLFWIIFSGSTLVLAEGCAIPENADWTINSLVVCKNKEITFNKNIIIEKNGFLEFKNSNLILNGNFYANRDSNLTLDDVILKVNASFEGQYEIIFYGGSKILINNSKISRGDKNVRYIFQIQGNGGGTGFIMENSDISNVGIKAGEYRRGFWVGNMQYDSFLSIKNSKFYDSYIGLNLDTISAHSVESENPNFVEISNNKFYNNDLNGIYVYRSSGLTIFNNEIFNNGMKSKLPTSGGAYFGGSENTIKSSQIYRNYRGIILSDSHFVDENTFSNNQKEAIFQLSNLYENHGSVIKNNIIKNGETGIYLFGNSKFSVIAGNIIVNNTFQNLTYGLKSNLKKKDIEVSQCAFSDDIPYQIYLGVYSSSSDNLFLVNTTYDEDKVNVGGDSVFNKMNSTNIFVFNKNGIAVPNARIIAKNMLGNDVSETLTDSNGVASASLTDYHFNSTRIKVYDYNHTIYAIAGTRTNSLNVSSDKLHDLIITLPNGRPIIENVSISPQTAFITNTLTAIGNYFDEDFDAESGSAFKWFRNGRLMEGQTGNTLDHSNFVKGDKIIVEYMPSDGFENGAAVNSSETIIQNSAPAINNVKIYPPSAYKNSVLEIRGDFFDYDNDLESNSTFRWLLNGVLLENETKNILTFVNFTAGDAVIAEYIPSDGYLNGTAVNATITIEDALPAPPNISIPPGGFVMGGSSPIFKLKFNGKEINYFSKGKIELKLDDKINYISFDLLKINYNSQIIINKIAFDDNDFKFVYYAFNVTKTGIEDENIKNAVIGFNVKKIWINENNINASSIMLNRYSDEKWEKLRTKKVNETGEYVEFESQSNGFSVFVVSGEPFKANVNNQKENVDIKNKKGFLEGIMGAFIFLGFENESLVIIFSGIFIIILVLLVYFVYNKIKIYKKEQPINSRKNRNI